MVWNIPVAGLCRVSPPEPCIPQPLWRAQSSRKQQPGHHCVPSAAGTALYRLPGGKLTPSQLKPGHPESFVLFLESFAPLVNSLNLGIASPLVLGPPPLQLAQIKTHLALQQLTSAAAAGPAPPHAWVNQALLKSIMFGPRGASPQRPREPNPCGVTPPGSFPAGDAADLQRKPAPRAPQRAPRGLSGQESFQSTLSHRIKVLVTLHRPDPRQVKEKPNLHQEQKAEPRSARWDGGPRAAGAAGPKPPGPARGAEQSSNAQNRYTPESASSILASFGLSNEDLEELSRYPDDQLTPENMPLILREIRIRKMGHSASGARPRSRGEETVGSTSGAAIKSKVIDYGHASKYGYTEDPLEVRAYNPEEPTEDPLEASIYNPEALSRENREDFQREQNMPVVVPPPSVPCNPMFPVEDLIKPAVFQNGSSNPGSFFPAVPARKVPPLCPSPVGLPVVKPVAQPAMPAMPPVLPPILPPILPPLAQPILPPVMPPLVQQSVTQHIISPLPQPPFSAVLITTVSQHEQIPHERIPHEPGPSQPGAQSGLAPGPKPFQPEPEGPIRSPFGIVKASWLPAFLQHGAHKTKRWPTSTMMNDYYATSPRAFPHMCSLCSIECTHMEDWILHQNSTSHIESCRQLRQQYPDWNPESYSSKRNAGDRKENQTPKRCSTSASRSPSPRRSRGSGSSSARRRSRSRSRSPGRYWPTRPRCRSPRPMRRPSPRHRSRSPQRSRNPLRTSPRPRRSASNDWAARRSSGSQDRKPSLETVVKTLRPDFVAEITKHKSLQAAGQGPSGSGKPPRSHQPVGKKLLKIRVSSKTSKKVVTPIAGSSSSPPEMADLPQSQEVEEDEEDASTGAGGAHPAADNRLLTEELLSFGTVLQISDLPDDGFTDQDIKNIFQPFGKVSDILVLRSRNEAFLEMNYKEAVIAAVKYGETVPVVVNGKRVKISIAEKPKESPGPAKTMIKKRTQTPKKVAPSTKKHRAPSTKTTKPLPAEAPEAPEAAAAGSAAVEAQAAAAGSAAVEAQAAEPESGSGEDRQTEPVTAAETQHNGAAEPAPAPEKLAPVPEAVLADVGEVNEAVADQEAPRAAVKSEEPPAPAGKDWILHQNSTSHIESCRQLRQQYPDWNPESYSSKRNAGDRKENQTPKRCSASASRSPSPRRSRGSGSSSARRRSRSRSRSPGRYWPTRPRCRSPRPMRRPSPRHRSRSPQRSRNPLRTSPRPRRSASNDWAARRSSGSQDRKPSLETVVKTLRPDFVAEITKHKSLQAAGQGPSGSGKPPRSHQPVGKKLLKIRVSSKTSKKVVTPIAGSSSSPPEMADLPQSQEVEEDEDDASTGAGGAHPAADNRLLTEELLSFGTVLQISDLPDDGFTDQDIKNIFQPFGKVSDILVLRSRNEAFLEMNYKEAVIAAVEYGKTVPVVVNGKRVKISVAEKPKESPDPAKTVIKKRTQTPKKVAPSTKKHRAPSTKTTKPLPEAPEAPEAAAAGSAAVEAQAAEPESGSGEDRQTEPVTAAETQHNGAAEPAPAPEKLAPVPEAVLADVGEVNEAVADQEAPRVAVKSEEPPAPAGKEPDDTCVVLISNLPEKGYSVEEIFNLAKPFGGLRDVLILSSHKKAYLEINRKSADSMVKFYTCFAISLDGNQLCISMVPQYKTIKDEEAIFTTLIKDSDPKVNTETIHKQFVHLGNLPDDGYRELEVVCVGLRFGRVDHYVILKNKNKAILQLDSPRSARSMHGFLQQQPYTMGEHTLTCALSPRGHAAQAEVVKKEVKKEEPSEGSSGFKNDPEAPGAVQTAAAHPPAEPSVAKQAPVSSSPSREEASAGQTEPSESRRDGAAREPPPGLAETSTEKVDAGVEVTVTSVKPTAAESSQARSEAMLLPPSSAEKEDHPEPALFEPAVVSASEKDVEEQDEAFSAAALEPAGGLSAAGQGEDVPPVGLAAGEPTGAGPEALPPEPNAPSLETASAVGTQTNKLGAPEKNTISVAVKTEQEISVIPITEKKPVLKTGAAMEKQLDVAGADAAVKAAEPVLTVGRAAEENPEELLVKTEAETEKKLDKSVTKAGTAMENAPNAVSENNEGGLTKAHQSKGTGPAKTDETLKAVTLNSSLSIKDSSCVGKTILKAVVYLPDISKSRCPVWRNQPCLWKGGQQKAPSKPETRSQTTMARKTASKEEAHPRPGGSRCRVSRSCVVAGKGGNGRNSSQQEKECRAGSKLAQEGESRISSVKKDAGSTKVSIAGNTKTAKGGTSSSAKQKEEEKLFPFNLDEFVTVDEVVEETEPPVRPRRNPPRAKRKDAAKPRPNCEPGSKRRKGKSSVGRAAERQPSFVTLDETEEEEEEEEVTARLMAVANLDALSELQGLVVVDEVMEEEEPLLEAVKDPQALVTLDELSDQDELGSQKDVLRSVFEEPDLKAEPLVTVDEIGEVEELPLSEPVGLGVEDALKHKEDEKGDPADGSSQVPDDPSALVTVDEIQEDADNNPLVTLDEVNEDEDDFLADFNRLKEELNFVTVDEVGEEDKEEENPFPGKNLASGEEDEDDVAVAGPEEMGVLQDTRPEVVPANSKSRGKLSGRRAGLREGLIAPELEPRNEITGKERLKQKFTATQKVEDNGGDERSSR
ncbi:zinc finger protein 638 isoform X3 [Caloenas nicobarica]|uniref:zinc finger protein 638 isoform X3 n=1 Tax=Caloenas nicobarica TaxID=187106 RepID=UPI0032B70332